MPLKDRERQREYDRQRYLANAEQVKARSTARRLANPERIKEAMRVDYMRNREKRLAQKREYYKLNREEIRAYQKSYAAANPEKITEGSKKYRDRNRDILRDRAMHKRSGFTLASKQATIESQGGRCAICRASFNGMRARDIHADHCHARHRPRGVLCNLCNLGIGRFNDDPVLLRAAAMYLEQHLDRKGLLDD